MIFQGMVYRVFPQSYDNVHAMCGNSHQFRHKYYSYLYNESSFTHFVTNAHIHGLQAYVVLADGWGWGGGPVL
jgi:hypothetical protein